MRGGLTNFLPPRIPRAVFAVAVLSVVGTLAFIGGNIPAEFFANRWSPAYLMLAPFIHAGAAHAMFNILALHFIGGQMLLPLIGEKRFLLLLLIGATAANVANNIFSDIPAVGISGGIMALLACVLYPFHHAKMKFLLIHDLLKLPPFPLYAVAVFVIALDIAGIIFDWRFFAHWGHLGGFASGAVFGYCIFRRR